MVLFTSPANAAGSATAIKLDVIDTTTLVNTEAITVSVTPAAAIKKITLSFAGASWTPSAPISAPESITLGTSLTACSKYPALKIKVSGVGTGADTCHLQKPGPSTAELDSAAASTTWGTVTFEIAAGALTFAGTTSVLTVESWDGSTSGTIGTLTFTTPSVTPTPTPNPNPGPTPQPDTVTASTQSTPELAQTGVEYPYVAPISAAALVLLVGLSSVLARRRRT